MIVVGFNWHVAHDHAVAVIEDGRLVFAVEEERFTRHKHSPGEAPLNALKAAYRYLMEEGVKPKDVDAYAVNWDPQLYPPRERRAIFMDQIDALKQSGINITQAGSGAKAVLRLALPYLRGDYVSLAASLVRAAIRELNEEVPSKLAIYPVRHHLAHAASAYYFSGFPSATAIVIDGIGESESTTVWHVKGGEFELVASVPAYLGSIGALWEVASVDLGFHFLEGPGKLMGLAPYGALQEDLLDKFERLFVLDEGRNSIPYRLRNEPPGNSAHSWDRIWNWHKKLVDEVAGGKVNWNPRGQVDPKAAAIARALQEFTDRLFVHLGRWAREHTGEDKVALAGGVALNARANMELHYSKIFNDMFIFPAANDAGTPVGAAAYVYEHVLGGKMRRERLRSVYLGPEYGDDEVKRLVQDTGFRAEYVGEDVGPVAELVAKGAIVAWYQGRAELGPRALGNRSIVADPRRKDYWRLVNSIKGREWWRPLAPSLLDEDKERYFEDPVSHEFMILMFRYRDRDACERVPVVCHVDMTARPQTVTRDQNRTWYDMIKAFKEVTGEGIVMNTSFNLAGEPLVETPQEALRDFALKRFDALYLQGWLIHKR